MSSKSAIIASDLPVLREILIDEHNALLVDPDSKTLWYNQVMALIQDSKKAKRLAKNAFEQFETRHTWNQRARLILEHYLKGDLKVR